MREFRALHSEFARAHVTVAGVSVDSPETNRRWMERLDLPYPLLTDRERQAGRAFGILSRVGIGPWSVEFLRRATVLIARDGQVAAVWNRVKVRGHAAEVLKLALALERAEGAETELRAALGPALLAAGRYTEKEQVETWKRWIEEVLRHSRVSGEPAILVLKEKNVLVLLSHGEPLRRYPAEIGKNALASKRQRGDRATPEGRYRVVEKKDVGHSAYHRALLLDYPNAADRERFDAAKRRGEIPRGAAIGGQIEIHGEGGRGQNWTDGCIALANADIDDLFARVRPGTRVTIVGGEGSDGAFSSLLARVKEGS